MSNPPPKQPISMAFLERVLSKPRLDKYRTPGATPREVMGRYRWNVALCESLYPGLHHLEVAFRNSLHEALKEHFQVATWFDLPWLLKREQDKVTEAKRELGRRNSPLEADRIVAELSFGFWTSLVERAYDQTLWKQKEVIRRAFPSMPNRLRTRSEISQRMRTFRMLRNRVFHYEPVWHWGDLAQQYAGLRQALHWFEPQLLGLLPTAESFEEIYARGPGAYEVDVS